MKTGSSIATPTEAACAVCAAPALSPGGDCAFCGAPLDAAAGDGAGLLDYLAPRLPGAEAGRGMLGKGPVRDLKVRLAGRDFHARLRKEKLELTPSLAPAEWAAELVTWFTAAAVVDVAVRRALSRAGWSWRGPHSAKPGGWGG